MVKALPYLFLVAFPLGSRMSGTDKHTMAGRWGSIQIDAIRPGMPRNGRDQVMEWIVKSCGK
jgi:hypothetical protein